jgi:hypothetical protein
VKKGHSEEQTLRALRRAESDTRAADICPSTSPSTESALVFRAADAAVTVLVERDRYVRNALFTQWKMRGWNIVVGG